MKTQQMQYFLKVAETGNYTLAAQELFISQSSLSKQIMALERELGVALIDRSRRQISLTRAGEAFRRHAARLNDDYLDMLATLNEYKTAPSFAILAIPVIARYGITSRIARFRSEYPQFDFTLEEREASLILPALNDRQYDLAFLRDIHVDDDAYAKLLIASDEMVVAVSPAHRFARRPSVALAELADESFIGLAKGTLVHELALEACRQAGFEPHIYYESLRADTICDLVAAESGVALMMEAILRRTGRRDVVSVPLEKKVEGNLVLAWLKRKKLSTPARAFVEFMGKEMAG